MQLFKAGKKSKSSFFHSFLAVFPLLVMQQVSSFFKQVWFFLKKNGFALLGFFSWVPYMQILDMNIISSGKVSIVSVNRAGGSGGVLRPVGVLEGGAPLENV